MQLPEVTEGIQLSNQLLFQEYIVTGVQEQKYFFTAGFAGYVYSLLLHHKTAGFSKQVPYEKNIALWIKSQIENMNFGPDESLPENELNLLLFNLDEVIAFVAVHPLGEQIGLIDTRENRNKLFSEKLIKIRESILLFIKARTQSLFVRDLSLSIEAMPLKKLDVPNNEDDFTDQTRLGEHDTCLFTKSFASYLFQKVADMHEAEECYIFQPKEFWMKLKRLIRVENIEAASEALDEIIKFTANSNIAPPFLSIVQFSLDLTFNYIFGTQPVLFEKYKKRLSDLCDSSQKLKEKLRSDKCWMLFCGLNAVMQLPLNFLGMLAMEPCFVGNRECRKLPEIERRSLRIHDNVLSRCYYNTGYIFMLPMDNYLTNNEFPSLYADRSMTQGDFSGANSLCFRFWLPCSEIMQADKRNSKNQTDLTNQKAEELVMTRFPLTMK